MGTYATTLKDRRVIATDTIACSFEKPAGFDFAAGQSIDLSLIDPPETDGKGNTRAFSIASAPHEPLLMIATRIRDTAFKHDLKGLSPGAQVKIEGPFGSMTLHRNITRPAVILAGGIGITPFRSMVLQAAKANTGHRLFLFYSNRTPGDAAFLTDLQDLTRKYPRLTLVATMTKPDRSGDTWNGEQGYIDKAMLRRYVGELLEPVYYMAGPPVMVAALKEMLLSAGIQEDDIVSEDFSGY